MAVEIIPAILPRTFKDLCAHLERIRGVSRKVQVDMVGGGFFAFNRTWPFRGRASFDTIIKEDKGLPYWTEFDVEADLMVDNPKELALSLVRLRTARIIVHAVRPGALEAAQALADYDDDDHPFPVGVGVAVGVEDPLDILEPFEHIIDQVDGGVSLKNAHALVQAGATHLVAGSAVFGAKDTGAALKALYTEANNQS